MTDTQSTPSADAQANQDRGSSFTAELERDRAHRAKGKSLQPLARLWPFIARYPVTLAAFLVFLALASGLTLALPAAFRVLVDCGFGGQAQSGACQNFALGEGLSGYFAIGLAVALALGLSAALRYFFISVLGERVVADLRRSVFDHILRLNPAFFASARTGEVVSRLTTDAALIQTVVGSSASVAIRTAATTGGAILLMALVSWKLTLMVLAVGPVILGPILVFGRRVQRLSRASQDGLAEASARASEALNAVETVQAFTREPEERARFADAVEQAFNAARRRIIAQAGLTAVLFSLTLCGLIAVLWFGATQVQSGALSPGAMTQFVMYAFVAVSGAGFLSETYAEIMRAAGATERLMELLAAQPDIAAPQNPVVLRRPARGRVAFEAVDFRYPQRLETDVLHALSFAVEPGERVALVGPSGAGKSTIFQLIMRFYDPSAGTVSFDGVDLTALDPLDLRRQLAVVSQNAPLFSGSALENIRFGRPEASAAEVRAAAEAAYAAEFIAKLPQGFDTDLGSGANTLSGGQRQRIAIARAILRDAPLVLLDEATSALDAESERAVQAAFDAIAQDRTTLVIAHRLATVQNADRILVLEDGRLVEQGAHMTLIGQNGLYARLAALQFDQAA